MKSTLGGNTEAGVNTVYTSGLFSPEDFSLTTLTPEQIRYGVVLRLPFRIRVGGLVQVPAVDAEAVVWLRNRVVIPKGSHLPAVLHGLPDKDRSGYQALWTEVVVLLAAPVLQSGAVEAVKAGDLKSLGLGGNLFRALSVLNEVVFAYSEAVGSMFGGASLRFLSDTEFFDSLRLEFGFVAPSDYVISERDVVEILDWRPPKEFRSLGQLSGELDDLPPNILADVPAHVARLREHAYHELAFKAKMAMLTREPLVALVLACAALEGAHAAVLRHVLMSKLSDRPKGGEDLIENFSREQGIFTLIELTSYAVMDPTQRPTAEELTKCRDALTMRNGIVHAKQKGGTYKLRQHTFMDLSNAYSAVLVVFRRYTDFLKLKTPTGVAT